MANDLIASMVLLIWLYLLAGRGGFWLAAQRDDDGAGGAAADGAWPAVAAVIPARDEAGCVGETVTSLLRQTYAGPFTVILVDDQSSDGTAQVARDAAAVLGAADRLTVVSGRALPAGWTGKLWAQQQSVELAENLPRPPDYLLFTDADIAYEAGVLTDLVARAQGHGLVLTSLMVKLRCESFAERLFVPAFIFFFQMLYPFAWANNPRRATAAAAGGCMLVRREALERSGGLAPIRGARIDDVALGQVIKGQRGRCWLGLSTAVVSVRPYPRLADLWQMVARSAYIQLRYSPWLLAGTVAGLAFIYLLPPAGAITGLAALAAGTASPASAASAAGAGLAGWALMSLTYLPMLRLYRLSPLRAPGLPLIALLYTAMTVDSAWRHYAGRGAEWKGRTDRARLGFAA